MIAKRRSPSFGSDQMRLDRARDPVSARSALTELIMEPRAITAGRNPPKDINVIIEIPLGGAPVKYELDKASGALIGRPLSAYRDVLSGQLRLHPADPVARRRSVRRAGDQPGAGGARRGRSAAVRSARCMMEDEAGGDEKIIAVPVDALAPFYFEHSQLPRPAEDHVRADRALLPALQGSGKGQMGHHRQAGSTSEARSSWCARRSRGAAFGAVKPSAARAKPGEQAGDRKRDGDDDIERRKAKLAALVEQGRIEREGRKGGVAAENAGGEEQPPVLQDVLPKAKQPTASPMTIEPLTLTNIVA